jgi:hypothetical protein
MHGYRESNKNIFKVVEECAVRTGEKLTEKRIEDIVRMMKISQNDGDKDQPTIMCDNNKTC